MGVQANKSRGKGGRVDIHWRKKKIYSISNDLFLKKRMFVFKYL